MIWAHISCTVCLVYFEIMYVYTHIHTYTCICTYIHTYIHRRLDQCSTHAQFVSSVAKLHALATADAAMARSFLHCCMQVQFVCECEYVHIYVYIHICIYIYIYVYLCHTNTLWQASCSGYSRCCHGKVLYVLLHAGTVCVCHVNMYIHICIYTYTCVSQIF